MFIEAECIYSSCACNKTPNAIDWGKNNLICYGACNVVHIYSHEKTGGKRIQTLNGHKKAITSVHWIKRLDNAPENELIATSADHNASIWRCNELDFELSCYLTGHTNVVRNATGLSLNDGKSDLVVVTLSTDSSIKVWNRIENEVVCCQTISLGNGFALSVQLTTLNTNNELAMALAKDDANLHIYIQDKQNLFIPAVKLVGHEDWIQNIDIVKDGDNTLIATSSQDSYIRIWKVSTKLPELPQTTDLGLTVLKVDATTFQTNLGETYSVALESVLSGHENWVYSCRWHQSKEKGELLLLSSSMDKTIIIWEHDTTSNIWMDKIRFGEVGGNTLGFFGAVFSPSGENVIAHGHHGSIHMWQLNKEDDTWSPGLSIGGHYSPVEDLAWDPEGEYLLSCSADQTTRLHAPYVKEGSVKSWYEIARPQVHGYDMVCLAVLDRFKYVSAGDEKVLRVFEAPRSFAECLKQLTNLDSSAYLTQNLVEGASVPSLGLSNKAVFSEDIIKNMSIEDDNSQKHPKDRYPDFYYTPTLLMEPPTEETLLQNTLWPETQKLYGHPYEVFTVASNHAGTLVASACKASKLEHAGIILWDTSTWKQLAYLTFHTLTVTQLEFSPNDEYLLSVSRDRMWALYKYFPDEPLLYRKIANLDKKSGVHTRIIWSCSWSFDSLFFCTSSRDKKVAVWGKNTQGDQETEEFSLCLKPLEVDDSATAVSFAPCLINNKYLIAIGMENGSILLSSWCNVEGWNVLQKLGETIAHHLNINRLKFSPVTGQAGSKEKDPNILQLASCSNDHHTKIYNIYISSSLLESILDAYKRF